MEITPLAFDSFGARSMATVIETDDLSILIDPGVALGPSRHRLPPHPLEIKRERELWQDINDHAARADVLVVSHYHYDHHNPEEPMLYGDKIL
ncbi:MAG TPA: MBL fold metallo-hydrolase, partial [Methanosarcinales archaeon]|nr:MBL fold metallo-hydrolase [Methanosarcinales archaeon]